MKLKIWEKVIGDLLDARKVKIPRCVLPDSYKDGETKLDLCLFCDGGESASIARCFVRASLPDGGYHVSNLVNTFKLGDLSNSGAPKSEIQSMVNATSLIQIVVSVLSHLEFASIHLFSDSKACLGSLNATHSRLKLFFSERPNVLF